MSLGTCEYSSIDSDRYEDECAGLEIRPCEVKRAKFSPALTHQSRIRYNIYDRWWFEVVPDWVGGGLKDEPLQYRWWFCLECAVELSFLIQFEQLRSGQM